MGGLSICGMMIRVHQAWLTFLPGPTKSGSYSTWLPCQLPPALVDHLCTRCATEDFILKYLGILPTEDQQRFICGRVEKRKIGSSKIPNAAHQLQVMFCFALSV
jgi:hypothetical protein